MVHPQVVLAAALALHARKSTPFALHARKSTPTHELHIPATQRVATGHVLALNIEGKVHNPAIHVSPFNTLDDKVHKAAQGAATDLLITKFLTDTYNKNTTHDKHWFDEKMSHKLSSYSNYGFDIINKKGISLLRSVSRAEELIDKNGPVHLAVTDGEESYLIIPTKTRAQELVTSLALKQEPDGTFSAQWRGEGVRTGATAKADDLAVLENDCGQKDQGHTFAMAYKLEYTDDGLTLTRSDRVLMAFFRILSLDPFGNGDDLRRIG